MALFELGSIEISPAAEAALAAAGTTPGELLARHASGDWGAMDERDREENAFALANPTSMFLLGSLYRLATGAEILVLTANDRSCTRLLLPDEEQALELSAAAGYAAWAKYYDVEPNPLIAAEPSVVEPLLAGLSFETALDVCAGTGRYALALARRGAEVTAFDQSGEMLAVLRENAGREGLAVAVREGALEDGLPFASNGFDLVVCALALCHVPGIGAAVRELARVLKPGGHLLITDFHPDAVAAGNRTLFVRPGTIHLLPTFSHTRDGYLEAVTAAGCELLRVLDLRFRDVPEGYFTPRMIGEFGDANFGLVVLARKQH